MAAGAASAPWCIHAGDEGEGWRVGGEGLGEVGEEGEGGGRVKGEIGVMRARVRVKGEGVGGWCYVSPLMHPLR